MLFLFPAKPSYKQVMEEMIYSEWLDKYSGYTEHTIETYKKYANEYEKCNFDIYKLLDKYCHGSNTFKNLLIASVKNYCKHTKIPFEFKSYKKERNIQKCISYDEYLLIKNELAKFKNYKYLLIISLLFETGIRSNELLNIKVDDVNNNKILINGKGRKQRIVTINDNIGIIFDKYIRTNELENKIFDFSYKDLYWIVTSITKKILGKSYSPHCFRRGLATYCNDNNVDIYTISQYLGHSNINMTALYIKNNSTNNKISSLFKK